jgi:hypothetical protein
MKDIAYALEIFPPEVDTWLHMYVHTIIFFSRHWNQIPEDVLFNFTTVTEMGLSIESILSLIVILDCTSSYSYCYGLLWTTMYVHTIIFFSRHWNQIPEDVLFVSISSVSGLANLYSYCYGLLWTTMSLYRRFARPETDEMLTNSTSSP